MTLYQFNVLDNIKQAETLWAKGVHIAERFDDTHSIILYQIEGFYCEVWYCREHNKIEKFRTFSSVTQLEPYLPNIDINNLNE